MRAKLKSQRLEKQWSQAEVARRTNLARSTYCLLEQGKRNPSLNVATRLSDLFGIPIQELFADY